MEGHVKMGVYNQIYTNKYHQKIKKTITKICPECHNKHIIHDKKHQEEYCTHCGLIITSPPVYDIITPGYSLKIQTYTFLLNTPVLIKETIITPEQQEQTMLRKLAMLYPPSHEK